MTCSIQHKLELEKIQHEAGRIVTGATKLISINDLYAETCWETLSSRRRKHKLITFYKMFNSLSPEYLYNLIPQQIGDFQYITYVILTIFSQYMLEQPSL